MTSHLHDDISALSTGELYRYGSEALDGKRYADAHRFLQAAVDRERDPAYLSQLALAIMLHVGNVNHAASLCQEALRKEPKNPEHYLRLGMVFLLARRRKEAVRMLQLGLRAGKHPQITRLLNQLGHRKRPVLPFLSRANPLNKYLGKLRSRISARG
ncbi:hypothetical protein GMSM_01340 [Geomonas sp. Red276]